MTQPQILPQAEFFPLLEEVLQSGGEASFTPTGNSMLPLLRSGLDTVTLRRPDGPLHRYDLPLYRRENGHYVLHRVVGRDASGYRMRGDAQFDTETGITDAQIVGVVTSFVRAGKRVCVTDRRYRLYCRLWSFGAAVWLRHAMCALHGRLTRRRTVGQVSDNAPQAGRTPSETEK